VGRVGCNRLRRLHRIIPPPFLKKDPHLGTHLALPPWPFKDILRTLQHPPIPAWEQLGCTLLRRGPSTPAISITGKPSRGTAFWARYRANHQDLATPLGRTMSPQHAHSLQSNPTPVVPIAPITPCCPLPAELQGMKDITNRDGLLCHPTVVVRTTITGPRFEPPTTLAAHREQYWRHGLAMDPLLDATLLHGYAPERAFDIEPAYFHNPSVCPADREFLQLEILSCLQVGSILPWDWKRGHPQIISPIFATHDPSGKRRMIIDLRYFNLCLRQMGVSYEDLRFLAPLLQLEDQLLVFDLKSGYHHLPMHRTMLPFLCFTFNGVTYHFTVLPFGLSPACHVFTRLTAPLRTHHRTRHHRLCGFIDDFMYLQRPGTKLRLRTAAPSAHAPDLAFLNQPLASTLLKLGDFVRVGWVIALSKTSPLHGCTCTKFLGVMVDTTNMRFFVPPPKCTWLLDEIAFIQTGKPVSAHRFQRFVGKLISLLPALKNTRGLAAPLHHLLAGEPRHITLSPMAAAHLQALVTHWEWLNGVPTATPEPDFILWTDSTKTSYGAHLSTNSGALVRLYRGDLPTDELPDDAIAFYELWAAVHVLLDILPIIAGQHLRLHIDNTTALGILRSGSSPIWHYQELASSFWLGVTQAHVFITGILWVPSAYNVVADCLSRLRDPENWQLEPLHFLNAMIAAQQQHLPHPTVDLFATARNHQLTRWVSQFWDIGAAGVNGFAFPLDGEIPYCNPPFSLITSVVARYQACRIRGYMVVPVWRDQPWWPLVQHLAQWRFHFPRGQLYRHISPTYHNCAPRWRSQLLFFDFS